VESAVIKVAKKNGATLFLPSQFGFDFVVAWVSKVPMLRVSRPIVYQGTSGIDI
jgi:hypothetical protein